VGKIARAVNAMIAGFSDILADVHDTAFSVSASSSEILAAATQIAKGAEYGSDHVRSTSSAVEEMAASMSQVSRHADASADRARQVLDHVQQGDQAVNAAFLGMTKIDAAVLHTAENMQLLEQRSREIFQIIGLIEEIASQSRLLSLNAAIEAAHAGDAGRSFAVVADEVRRLADSSTQATKNVTERIEAMLQETETVRQAMENAMREVRDGRALSEQARKSLQEISTLVQDSVSLALQISGASGEQAQVTKTVAEAMQTIANVTVESAASARETTRAVQDLVNLAERLTRAISRFKIDH
jgi:methyl-accepting chemotaxis protein